MRIFLATLALLIELTSANAQIAGQNDPQFKAALAQWLDGEDLAALTALSELAKADNRAAQVFLGRVSETSHTHNHITDPMERKARIALMRQSGGLSGKNWLKAASQDVPLAAAFLQAKILQQRPAAIEALLNFNEISAALPPLHATLIGLAFTKNQDKHILQLASHPNLPDNASYFRFELAFQMLINKSYARNLTSSEYINNLRIQTENRLTTKDAIYQWSPYYDDIDGTPIDFPQSLIDSPYYAPLKAICSSHCSDDIPNCMHSMNMHISASGIPIWVRLSSPVETLLSTSDYYNSPRVSDDLIRLLKIPTHGALLIKPYNQCAHNVVFAK